MELQISKACSKCESDMVLIEEISSDDNKFWLCKECINWDIDYKECNHEFVTYKINYHRHENDFHVVTKCSLCGQHHKAHKKSAYNLDELPEFDYKALEANQKQASEENIRKRKIFSKHIEEARIAYKKKTNTWNIQQWYYGYLESNMWQRKRDWILERAGYKCERCGVDTINIQIHHKTYERVGYEEPEDLMAVCKMCHGTLHGENPDLDIVSQFRLHEYSNCEKK